MGVCHSRERDHLHGHAWCREGALGAQTLGLWGAQGGEQSPKKRGDTWIRAGKVTRRPRQPFLQEPVCVPQPFPPQNVGSIVRHRIHILPSASYSAYRTCICPINRSSLQKYQVKAERGTAQGSGAGKDNASSGLQIG